jgi:hypothetical protein
MAGSLAVLLLAGCSLWPGGDEPSDSAAPETAATAVTTGARTAADPAIIEAHYTGPRSPDLVRLVAPDGTRIEPLSVDRDTRRVEEDGRWPDVHVGVTGGSSSKVQTGIGIGFPLFGNDTVERPPESRTVMRFRLPDPADYDANWKNYRVLLLFEPGTDRESRIEMMPPHPSALLE